jgi:DNA ligase-associated metallophosphoesterase
MKLCCIHDAKLQASCCKFAPMLGGIMELEFGGQHLLLSGMKCVFRPATKTLFLADLHLGKAAHFRKHALPLPQMAHQRDYHNLQLLLTQFEPQQVVFLGDLFHSAYNQSWKEAALFFQSHPQVHWILVPGNHDILEEKYYLEAGLTCMAEGTNMDGLSLFHHPPLPEQTAHIPGICGHVHPGYALRSKARDRMMLPCFYLRQNLLILPAFGTLTGLHPCIKQDERERFIGISGTALMEL